MENQGVSDVKRAHEIRVGYDQLQRPHYPDSEIWGRADEWLL